jgi:hypothetical protein
VAEQSLQEIFLSVKVEIAAARGELAKPRESGKSIDSATGIAAVQLHCQVIQIRSFRRPERNLRNREANGVLRYARLGAHAGGKRDAPVAARHRSRNLRFRGCRSRIRHPNAQLACCFRIALGQLVIEAGVIDINRRLPLQGHIPDDPAKTRNRRNPVAIPRIESVQVAELHAKTVIACTERFGGIDGERRPGPERPQVLVVEPHVAGHNDTAEAQ